MDSIWSINNTIGSFPPLKSPIKTDVLIIGGGMAGLLSAYMLKKKGIEYTLIDSGHIAGGVTQNTTAKITSQHHLIYQRIHKSFGQEYTREYAAANENAIKMYKAIVDDENISCHFESIPAYLYSTFGNQSLKEEYHAAQRAGIKCKLTRQTALPFTIKSALKFENQAQFNPLEFIAHISKNLNIYENTTALAVDKHTVLTSRGTIHADQIILTTHFPFINFPGYYFIRMHQERSYVVALEGVKRLDGAYLGIDGGRYSFRSYNDCILLGGSSHRTGKNEQGRKYTELLQAASHFYPRSQSFWQWSAQDCMTHDGIPYIGKFSSKIPNLYVATGFNKWGMSSSMAAAMILSDEISGKRSPYLVFNPQRSNLSPSFKGLATDTVASASGLIKQNLKIPSKKLKDIPMGHGGIIQHQGRKTGVYKSPEGKAFLVSTKCPHLGCELTWNPDELSWDCPCHGSRFDYKGKKINNPAMSNLTESEKQL